MVHGRIGRRAIKCSTFRSLSSILIVTDESFDIEFTHIVDGVPTTMKTVTRACPASRTIFVPMDATLQRLAIVVPDHTSPHNHPMPPFTKVDADGKLVFQKVSQVFGVVGATVNKIGKGTY